MMLDKSGGDGEHEQEDARRVGSEKNNSAGCGHAAV